MSVPTSVPNPLARTGSLRVHHLCRSFGFALAFLLLPRLDLHAELKEVDHNDVPFRVEIHVPHALDALSVTDRTQR